MPAHTPSRYNQTLYTQFLTSHAPQLHQFSNTPRIRVAGTPYAPCIRELEYTLARLNTHIGQHTQLISLPHNKSALAHARHQVNTPHTQHTRNFMSDLQHLVRMYCAT